MSVLSEEDRRGVTKLMMMNFARGCKETMKILEQNNSISDWHLPYYLLAVTFLELSAKLVLMKQFNAESFYNLEKRFKKLDHNLDKIYSKELITDKFLSHARISNVQLFIKDGIFRYDFYLLDKDTPVYVYDAESIKYALLSKKENFGFIAYQTHDLLQLCEDVFSATISNS